MYTLILEAPLWLKAPKSAEKISRTQNPKVYQKSLKFPLEPQKNFLSAIYTATRV